MGIKSEPKEVILLEELPEYLQRTITDKGVRRSQVKSIQKEIKLQGDIHEDYD